MPPLSVEATLYLFHHIILPPELPQESDLNAEYEDALLDTTIEVLCTFAETVRTEQQQVARYVQDVTVFQKTPSRVLRRISYYFHIQHLFIASLRKYLRKLSAPGLSSPS